MQEKMTKEMLQKQFESEADMPAMDKSGAMSPRYTAWLERMVMKMDSEIKRMAMK